MNGRTRKLRTRVTVVPASTMRSDVRLIRDLLVKHGYIGAVVTPSGALRLTRHPEHGQAAAEARFNKIIADAVLAGGQQ